MTMHVYQLLGEKQKKADPPYVPGQVARARVKGNQWYEARAECFQQAIGSGVGAVGIIVGTVHLYHRHAQQDGIWPSGPNSHHGMWLYLERLVNKYGHAYVPPLSWARNHPQHGKELFPTVPMVAAYQTKALQSLRNLDGPVGKLLCGEGYSSYTVGDYFFHNLSTHYVLDEPGSASTWREAHERAIDRIT